MPGPTVTVRMQEIREDLFCSLPLAAGVPMRACAAQAVCAFARPDSLLARLGKTHMNQTLTPPPSSSATPSALATARIAIISANWHSDVVHQARDACARQLHLLGTTPARIHQLEVPGAFEIPLMAQKLAQSGQFDAVIGCAVIVNGGIYHHEFVSSAVVDGLMRVQLDTGVPVFSVALTPYNFQPSEDLLGFFRTHFVQKGEEAAHACAQTLAAHAAADALLREASAA